MFQEIEIFDRNDTGTRDTRLAREGNEWFVFNFDFLRAQATPVENGTSYHFSQYNNCTGNGVRNIAHPKTKSAAQILYNKLKARYE